MLTIAVCLKYVRSELLFEKQLNDFEYSINPYDLFMLEQIIAFKKNCIESYYWNSYGA